SSSASRVSSSLSLPSPSLLLSRAAVLAARRLPSYKAVSRSYNAVAPSYKKSGGCLAQVGRRADRGAVRWSLRRHRAKGERDERSITAWHAVRKSKARSDLGVRDRRAGGRHDGRPGRGRRRQARLGGAGGGAGDERLRLLVRAHRAARRSAGHRRLLRAL